MKIYKKIFLFTMLVGYVTIKDLKYVKIYSVSPLNLIFNKVNGYFEEINGNKKLTLVPTNEKKEKTKNIENYWAKSEIYLDQ